MSVGIIRMLDVLVSTHCLKWGVNCAFPSIGIPCRDIQHNDTRYNNYALSWECRPCLRKEPDSPVINDVYYVRIIGCFAGVTEVVEGDDDAVQLFSHVQDEQIVIGRYDFVAGITTRLELKI